MLGPPDLGLAGPCASGGWVQGGSLSLCVNQLIQHSVQHCHSQLCKAQGPDALLWGSDTQIRKLYFASK